MSIDSTPTATGGASSLAGGILRIDLGAVVANWRLLKDKLAPSGAACAAVVKADAYGLGMAEVAAALHRAGCRTFFVALPEEGIALRALLPDADIHVFAGATAASLPELLRHRLVPVLNSLEQIAAVTAHARSTGGSVAADIHLDSGMNRLGLPAGEVASLAAAPALLDGLTIRLVMSHLACADEPDHPLNAQQLAAFTAARARVPALAAAQASFANSGGIFLGADFHFDLARPGAALYGLKPRHPGPNPMAQVVRLQGKILQVRDVDTPMTVGYGAAHRVTAKGRIATVGVGYADGYRQSLTNRGHAYLGDVRVPVVGRVSMDLIALDVSQVPPAQAVPGALVDLLGPQHDADALAAEAGTIGYEILTGLGRRFHRVYVPVKENQPA
ncbi:MAG TPA: alanine racemase [Alphaproteobacteria bacterium]|jgi:alanine racemase